MIRLLIFLLAFTGAHAMNHILRVTLPPTRVQYPESSIRLRSHRFKHVREPHLKDPRCASDAVEAFLGMLDVQVNTSSVLGCTKHQCAGGTMEELFEKYTTMPVCDDQTCEMYCPYPVLRVTSTIVAYGDEEEHIESWLRKYGPVAVAVDTSAFGQPVQCKTLPEPDAIALIVGYTPKTWTLQLPQGVYQLPRGQRACGIGSAVYIVTSKEVF